MRPTLAAVSRIRSGPIYCYGYTRHSAAIKKQNHKIFIVIIHLYSRIIRAASTLKMTATHAGTLLICPDRRHFTFDRRYHRILLGNVCLRLLRSRIIAAMALMKQKLDLLLTTAQKRCIFDYAKKVSKTPLCKTTEVIFDYTPSLAMKKKISINTDRLTYKMLMSGPDGQFLSSAFNSIRLRLTRPAFWMQQRQIL